MVPASGKNNVHMGEAEASSLWTFSVVVRRGLWSVYQSASFLECRVIGLAAGKLLKECHRLFGASLLKECLLELRCQGDVP